MSTQTIRQNDSKVLSHPPSPSNSGLSQFLQDLRGDGGLLLLGGHYEYPGVPSAGAIESASLVVDIQESLGSTNSLFRLFFNDIGASLFCVPGYQCSIVPSESVGQLPEVSVEWGDHLASLERALVADQSNWRTCADNIARHLRAALQPDAMSHPLVQRLTTGERWTNGDSGPTDWLADLEYLIYASNKPEFRPLLLTKLTRRALPPVLFEKTMNNAASRLLHRLGKKPSEETGLQVNDMETHAREFTVSGPDGTAIHLRREEVTSNGVKASNKCSALLAQLFAYSCKQVRSAFRDNDRITVCYIIPCYDRGRLFHGMHAFCELFTDVTKYFDVAEVTLCSGFYMTPDHSAVKCDTFVKQGSHAPRIRTVRLTREAANTHGD